MLFTNNLKEKETRRESVQLSAEVNSPHGS
jgi:hypothetical protein